MKKTLTLFALLVVSIAVVVLTTVHGQNPNSNSSKLRKTRADKRIANQYVVVLNDDVDDVEGEAVRLSRNFGGDRNGGHTYKHALKGFSVRMSEERAARLADDPRVAFVEENAVFSAVATQTNATWGLDRIDQRLRPLNGTYTYNATGTGVKIYIIDSGIRATHTDFGGRVISGFTAINDGFGTNDPFGHGTHVAGTAGGSHWGVAKNATLVSVRVLNAVGGGNTIDVIAGVDFVTGDHQQGQPAVANMSLGGPPSQAIDNAVTRSILDGVTFAIAAGNSNADACGFTPARVQGALTVGATKDNDSRDTTYSNYGTCLDLFAPGTNIQSAWNTTDTDSNVISGTSMAAPHVAGVAALYLEGNPSALPATVNAAIINNATQNVVSNAGPGSPNRLLYSLLAPATPLYEGFVDFASCDSIVGWAADRTSLNFPIFVSIYDGSTFVTSVVANGLRSDVGSYLGDNGLHGFAIPTPARFKDGQTHTLRVKFEDSAVNLTNSPQTLTCGTQTTYYEVVARHSGQCLDVFDAQTSNGTLVIQWPCGGFANQQWLIIPVGDNYFKFIARHSNKALAVLNGSLANGAAVVQAIDGGTAQQQWRLIDTDSGYMRIMARHSGKALEVDGGFTFNGAHVQQWDYFGLTHQQWLIRPVN
jgi:subtilisin family serine protease